MNGLDLFSGIGGMSEALSPWVRPIAYCESDREPQSMLLSRMARGELFSAPIWDDVRTLHGSDLGSSEVDIIYGGFPCQDISSCGNGEGLAGKRSGLFFEIIRLVRELKPTFAFLENVPAITTRGLSTIISEFSCIGYDSRWTIVSAKELGAPHIRRRWFLLAYANGQSMRISESAQRIEKIHAPSTLEDGKNPDSIGEGLEICGPEIGNGQKEPFSLGLLEGNDWDEYASFFHRMDNGIPYRGHRLRALGNSVVPIQAREAFKRLMGIQ